MLKGSKNARRPGMAIKHISVQNVEQENMFHSPVNADYVLLVGQKQQTIGLIEFITFF